MSRIGNKCNFILLECSTHTSTQHLQHPNTYDTCSMRRRQFSRAATLFHIKKNDFNRNLFRANLILFIRRPERSVLGRECTTLQKLFIGHKLLRLLSWSNGCTVYTRARATNNMQFHCSCWGFVAYGLVTLAQFVIIISTFCSIFFFLYSKSISIAFIIIIVERYSL